MVLRDSVSASSLGHLIGRIPRPDTCEHCRMLRDPRVVHAGIDVELVRDDVGLKDVIQTLVLRNRHDLVLIAVVQLVRRADTACLRLARGRTDDDPRQLDPPAVCEATRKSAG